MLIFRLPSVVRVSSCPRHSRLFHASSRQYNLVAPPDPISNLRPIIYDDAQTSSTPVLLQHPYSLSEFDASKVHNELGEYELQYKIQRQQLDEIHQNFWLDSNIRFEAAKEAILAGLPASSAPRDKEIALSEFYKQWVMQEKDRTDAYTQEWRRRNLLVIKLAARVKYQHFKNRFTSFGSGFREHKRLNV